MLLKIDSGGQGVIEVEARGVLRGAVVGVEVLKKIFFMEGVDL